MQDSGPSRDESCKYVRMARPRSAVSRPMVCDDQAFVLTEDLAIVHTNSSGRATGHQKGVATSLQLRNVSSPLVGKRGRHERPSNDDTRSSEYGVSRGR